MKKRHEALGLLDTAESHTKKRTIELKNHTIEIAEIDDQFVANTGLFMGNNQTNDNEINEKVQQKFSSFYSNHFSSLFRMMVMVKQYKKKQSKDIHYSPEDEVDSTRYLTLSDSATTCVQYCRS
jgi:hypothetical protein